MLRFRTGDFSYPGDEFSSMNPYHYLSENIERPERLSRLASTLAWLFPVLLFIHLVLQFANGYLIQWDVDKGQIPFDSPLRFWEPTGVFSIFVLFNLLLLSVIFVYIQRTGISTDPSATQFRSGGLRTVMLGFVTMVASVVVAAIVALISWLIFGSASAIALIPTGLAAMGWLQLLLGIAQVITGRDLLAEDAAKRAKK